MNSILKKKVKRSELVIDSLVRGFVFYFLDFGWSLELFPLLLLLVVEVVQVDGITIFAGAATFLVVFLIVQLDLDLLDWGISSDTKADLDQLL